jgi:glycine/D-amino acid oxidase-like deaminating enzyme
MKISISIWREENNNVALAMAAAAIWRERNQRNESGNGYQPGGEIMWLWRNEISLA